MLSSSIAVSSIGCAGRHDLVAGVVLERAFDDREAALHDLGLTASECLRAASLTAGP